jgi:hypothetical protein
LAVEVETRGGLTLFCPKCGVGIRVSNDRHNDFWLRAANWCDNCEEVKLLWGVWKLSPMTARTLVAGRLRLPKELKPDVAIRVLKLAKRKGLTFEKEQGALLVAAALDAKNFREPKCGVVWS